MGISSHVLDLTSGKPAAGVELTIARRDPADGWAECGRHLTDDDGRVPTLLPDDLTPGVYRLTAATGDYFRARGVGSFHPEVQIVFEVTNAAEHHHVPILLSPHGYTTYRGS